MNTVHTRNDLRQLQALPLNIKVEMSKTRIRQWIDEFGIDGVYVSFSGGKDSTVLLHLVREIYPEIIGVFVDTGLEYPEIREFVKTVKNIVWLKPRLNFRQVIEKFGYPFFSKEVSKAVYYAKKFANNESKSDFYYKKLNGTLTDKNMNKSIYCCDNYLFMLDAPFNLSSYCCDVMKKQPIRNYDKKEHRVPMTAQIAEESRQRQLQWLKHGCNAFSNKHPISNPLSFWTEQDILRYIKEHNLPIASVYGSIVADNSTEDFEGQMDISELGLIEDNRPLKTTGCHRTGCMFCGFGCHLEESPNRFEKMKVTHPKQYEYIMRDWNVGGLGYKKVIDWINEHGNMNIKY